MLVSLPVRVPKLIFSHGGERAASWEPRHSGGQQAGSNLRSDAPRLPSPRETFGWQSRRCGHGCVGPGCRAVCEHRVPGDHDVSAGRARSRAGRPGRLHRLCALYLGADGQWDTHRGSLDGTLYGWRRIHGDVVSVAEGCFEAGTKGGGRRSRPVPDRYPCVEVDGQRAGGLRRGVCDGDYRRASGCNNGGRRQRIVPCPAATMTVQQRICLTAIALLVSGIGVRRCCIDVTARRSTYPISMSGTVRDTQARCSTRAFSRSSRRSMSSRPVSVSSTPA